ncbi:hypothetical protein LRR18_04370 [Mangrovimonas sp. AS39]|uniref:hypothetical protein n=1 Tax=Mangrovimonas futianensis TaxID=2895523 RepID=UPI001E5F8098|nr:hypothetical protein [Mangrovimonas futianensis]MCF1190811.1 hypothetical protein [Mangrovimonas futianensis]MCF1194508.1 hypothetical protein [Mangrovimonas futianensis]
MSQKKIKVLFANIPTPGNRFVVDLQEGLKPYADVTWDCDLFWSKKEDFDIVHIHWPEYLSFEMESYLLNDDPLPKELWEELIDCLEYWKKHAAIVYTRHVQYPHKRHDEEFLNLYRVVSSYCVNVAHFANYSIKQFKSFYPEHTHVNHEVIPHQNYTSLPDKSTKEEARSYLDIDSKAKVLLVFGAIKEDEKSLIDKAFDAVPNENKVLLAPGWKVQKRRINYIRLREWVFKFDCWLASLNKKKRTNLGFIQEDEAHFYLNAADVLLIPRTNELNSGNITLGCTFGLVVVGKDSADIGEILKETGNPVFAVGDDESLNQAVNKAFELSKTNLGEQSKALAYKEWSIEKISKMYYDFYLKSIAKD